MLPGKSDSNERGGSSGKDITERTEDSVGASTDQLVGGPIPVHLLCCAPAIVHTTPVDVAVIPSLISVGCAVAVCVAVSWVSVVSAPLLEHQARPTTPAPAAARRARLERRSMAGRVSPDSSDLPRVCRSCRSVGWLTEHVRRSCRSGYSVRSSPEHEFGNADDSEDGTQHHEHRRETKDTGCLSATFRKRLGDPRQRPDDRHHE